MSSRTTGEDVHMRQHRDRLLMLSECANPHKPHNVKRRSNSGKLSTKGGSCKLSLQDFVRRDPGYTTDIEHLVFQTSRKSGVTGGNGGGSNTVPTSASAVSKTRSRLAEMFALSKHLQHRSADRDAKSRRDETRTQRSMDSILDSRSNSGIGGGGVSGSGSSVTSNPAGGREASASRRWEDSQPVRQTRLSPAEEPDMAATRGPNVSVLHLRNTSEPWETSPPSAFASGGSSRSYSSGRSTASSGIPSLTKHQSLGGTTSASSQGRHRESSSGFLSSGSKVNSGELFVNSSSCSRELSPVRWCDREVDGVYLGRSGWVQVQQRSLDENRHIYAKNVISSGSLQPPRRAGIKLADYHCNSEPGKCPEVSRTLEHPRPAYLPLRTRDYENKSNTPSPRSIPESYSPPSITPIISPPPAFQDRNKSTTKSRTVMGKPPFLPRANAIDSDIITPPSSPPNANWTTIPTTTLQPVPIRRQKLTPSPVTVTHQAYPRIPQTKSLEDTTTSRRSQFIQRYIESSSSSSSSMGFRSLDSCVNRSVMPRLAETTDSSIEIYEDADEEDNNSSSLALSVVSSVMVNSSQESVTNRPATREKTSPSGRQSRLPHHRTQRRSPATSDTNKQATCSSPSSSSSSEFPVPVRTPQGPSNQQVRRSAPARHQQPARVPVEDPALTQRVRRSRSLQLPDRKNMMSGQYRQDPQRISPQQIPEPHRVVVKMGNTPERNKRHVIQTNKPHSLDSNLDEEMLREAEVVTEFIHGSRSRAAAKALLIHRFNERKEQEVTDAPSQKYPSNNGYSVYFVGNNNNNKKQPMRPKSVQRGISTPATSPGNGHGEPLHNPCNSNTCDFWPHCAHRESLNSQAQSMMRLSQTYPSHQRSLDSNTGNSGPPDRMDGQMKRTTMNGRSIPPQEAAKSVSSSTIPPKQQSLERDTKRAGQSGSEVYERRPSPNKCEISVVDLSRKPSPINPKISRSPTAVGNSSCSSSSSDVWITTSDRTVSKSPKNAKSSDASTPQDENVFKNEQLREMILTRPGSAPADVTTRGITDAQQRSMSLPKSFLSASYGQGGHFPWKRQGTESLGSSPCTRRRLLTSEAAHTAPVTPCHEPNRRRSPSLTERRNKASSTPHLLEPPDSNTKKWTESAATENIHTSPPEKTKDRSQRLISGNTAESVLQKFRKTFSLRFQKKGSKDSCSSDAGDTLETLGEPTEEEYLQQVPSTVTTTTTATATEPVDSKEEQTEQKYRFGPLVWRSSKERKKTNKAARNAKCNSGDSGIQIEMTSGCGGLGGDSSESHDTDPPGDDLDSPPAVRRRMQPTTAKTSRPHSDLLNQVLIDKFKAELQSRAHRHQNVRRTHSDLGGQRLLQWDARSSYRRLMSSPAPLRGRPHQASPRRKPPDAPGGVQLRGPHHRRSTLRRSLSQPLDIDKLSPLMRTKTAGLRMAVNNVLSEDEHDGRGGTSEDDMSDSESSVTSFNERKKSLELAMDEEVVILAEAVFDHVAIEAEELAFRAGDVIEVLETVNRDWWWGSADGHSGWFPAAFVRLRVSQEDTVEDCLAAMASGRTASSQLRRRTSISLLSNEQVRTSVVRELVHTERDFVKVLTDVAEGYIVECRRRTDMFTAEQIQAIFINLEEMLKFQSAFLKDLEACIEWDAPHKSCVGKCFLTHQVGFRMYSDYCNSHPMATATLQELYQFNNYSKFFEACRLMRGLIEIPLDGYLLTPVQRICKYPLQLAELLKYTKADHPDYSNIKEALDVMRGVAVLINERKRRMESLEKIAAWQQRAEGWEGEDLIEISSQLIHQGEAIRITTGMWTQNIVLFLFDHQLIYCKKDILKRNTYVYKGRICLDTSEIIDLTDGKDPVLNVNIRHGIKVYSCVRDKWLLFCCRSGTEKHRWLQAFQDERKLVAQDQSDGLEFAASARQLARVAARCQRRPPTKPRGGKNYKQDSAYMGSTLQLNTQHSNSNSLGRKVGTWFMFGGNKKTRHHHNKSRNQLYDKSRQDKDNHDIS